MSLPPTDRLPEPDVPGDASDDMSDDLDEDALVFVDHGDNEEEEDSEEEDLDESSDSDVAAVPQALGDESIALPVLGCSHYPRGARVVAPCCGEIFWCRLCHDAAKDEGEADPRKQHKINRFAISECVCGACGLRQPVAAACAGCGLVMGSYYCGVCKFWENRDRGQFHCEKCGMCRVGGRANFFHCDRCGGCFPLTDTSHQSCVVDAMKSTCPVCLEDLAASTVACQRMKCGHMIHGKCLSLLLRSTYKCPLCAMTIVDMRDMFEALEHEIALTPMPEEYATATKHVLCNDCHQESNTKFHVLGLKCLHCNSFNTRAVAETEDKPAPGDGGAPCSASGGGGGGGASGSPN